MNLQTLGKLTTKHFGDIYCLLTLKVECVPPVVINATNLVDIGREDLMEVSMKLIFTNGTRAWTSRPNLDVFCQHAEQLTMKVGKYIDLTLNALANTVNGKYIYEIDEYDKTKARFSWKEKMADDEITVKLGSCELKSENPSQVICQMMLFSTERISELQAQTKASETEIKSLTLDRQKALEKFENFVSVKETLERDLYEKFAAVLNEKKMKIRQLEENLEKGSRDLQVQPEPSTSAKPNKKMGPNKKAKVVAGTSRSVLEEEDSGSDTDVEKPYKVVKHGQKSNPDESLLLENSPSEEFTFQPRKRVQRKK